MGNSWPRTNQSQSEDRSQMPLYRQPRYMLPSSSLYAAKMAGFSLRSVIALVSHQVQNGG
jgi:hypothetical protein